MDEDEARKLHRKFRKEYKVKHGHFPDDFKAQKDCKICQDEAQHRWDVVVGRSNNDNN